MVFLNTQKCLDKAYEHAKVQWFDDASDYIFFSDCHRGDDSVSDEFARNQTLMVSALNYYYDKGYTYVEAGDGDELWEHANFKHIRAAHTDVFTVMKQFYDSNRLVLLYGNHNIYLRNPHYVKYHYYYFYDEYEDKEQTLFRGIKPQEALLLKHKTTGQQILIIHGHQGDFWNDQAWFFSMLTLRYFWKFMHLVGFRNPASPAKNQQKRHKIEKNYSSWIKKHKIMLICGHTHRMKFSKPNKYPYFNIGCAIHTKGITGIEIKHGEIMLVQWRIQADKQGVLHTVRNIIGGPVPIEKYHKNIVKFE